VPTGFNASRFLSSSAIVTAYVSAIVVSLKSQGITVKDTDIILVATDVTTASDIHSVVVTATFKSSWQSNTILSIVSASSVTAAITTALTKIAPETFSSVTVQSAGTVAPSSSPSVKPSRSPTLKPTRTPSKQPSLYPTTTPTLLPTAQPSSPTHLPSIAKKKKKKMKVKRYEILSTM
jgi:hypothetical protein